METNGLPKKLLLIDDDDDFRELFRIFSKNYNCEWIMCKTGEEAVELLGDKSFNPEFCFLDYKLLKTSGEETFRQIKKIRPTLDVIILSGFLSTITIDSITRIGYCFFCKKPNDFEHSFFSWLFKWLRIEKKKNII